MRWLNALTKPYYVYRPAQVFRRVGYALKSSSARPGWVTLPWGHRIWMNPADDLGKTLNTAGINDLMVSESLFRLLGKGDLAVDVGANVGYTTSIMAACVSPGGTVFSFEPHPELFQELSRNVLEWSKQEMIEADTVGLFNAAVSDEPGSAMLIEPSAFKGNRGLSHLQATDSASIPVTVESKRHLTDLMTLDDVLKGKREISVLKVDVEGHEEAVFKGAERTLAQGQVRNIIFEDFHPYPGPSHRFLEQHGYQTFVVEEHWRGPHLVEAGTTANLSPFAPPNYLATLHPQELRTSFHSRGWQCLRCRSDTDL